MVVSGHEIKATQKRQEVWNLEEVHSLEKWT